MFIDILTIDSFVQKYFKALKVNTEVFLLQIGIHSKQLRMRKAKGSFHLVIYHYLN